MEITFKCEHCGNGLCIDEACAGLLMKCVHCPQILTIPVPKGHSSVAALLDAAPEEPGAPLGSCPFCRESIRKGLSSCDVCGAALDVARRNAQRGKRIALSVAVASLALVILMAAVRFFIPSKQQPAAAVEPRPAAPEVFVTPPSTQAAMAPAPVAAEPSNQPEPEPAMFEAPKPLSPAILGEALRTIRQIREINAVTKNKEALDYNPYAEQVGALATVVDDFLRVVEESGEYDGNPDLRELCKRASDAFFDHNLALNHWNVERSLQADKEAVRKAHQARMETASATIELSQAVSETTEELDELTHRVMRAINDRYDLWIDAHQQEDEMQALLARVGN